LFARFNEKFLEILSEAERSATPRGIFYPTGFGFEDKDEVAYNGNN